MLKKKQNNYEFYKSIWKSKTKEEIQNEIQLLENWAEQIDKYLTREDLSSEVKITILREALRDKDYYKVKLETNSGISTIKVNASDSIKAESIVLKTYGRKLKQIIRVDKL